MERVLSLLLVLAWFGSATAEGNASNSSDAVNITLVTSVDGVFESTTFSFSCVSNVSLSKINLMIDGTPNGTKFNRLTTDNKSDKEIDYSFKSTVEADNGTTFSCVGVAPDNKTYNSLTFTLQIYYPPRLTQGNNITIFTELSDLEDTQELNVTVLKANPPVNRFIIYYVTSNSSGITTKIDKSNTSGVVTFDEPMAENRGNFTFSVSNGYGNTSLTYNTFFGGAADMLNITCTPTYSSDDATIVCYANDYSDAPATGVTVSSPGLNEPQYYSFERIPARDFQIQVVSRDLTEIAPGNYTVSMTALNLIKNQSVFEKTYYVPGLKIDVYIESESNETAEGDVFSFTCRAPVMEYPVSFTILFNDEYTPDNDKRLVYGSLINGTQVVNLTDPTYLDNGLSLKCCANGTFKSPPLRLDVLYAPKYFGVLQSILVNGSTGIISLNMTSNPLPDATGVTWYHNNKTITGDKRLTLNASSILFSTVTGSDIGTYRVEAHNKVGSGTSEDVVPTLYSAPYFTPSNNSNIPHLVEGEDFYVTLNVTSNPPVNKSTWTVNGKVVNSTTGRIVAGLLNINITDLRYTDDKSIVQLNVSNEYGETTFSFNLNVSYSPRVTFPSETLFTYLNADTTLKAVVLANPPVSSSIWYHKGVVLETNEDVTVKPDSLSFKSISLFYNGSYTLDAYNSIGNLSVKTDIGIYFGPILNATIEDVSKNVTNTSQWVEFKDGSTFTLSCIVSSSFPAVKKFLIQLPCHKNESDCNEVVKTDNKTYINVTITGASSKKNSKNYTCTGRTGHTSGNVTFQTFVGGPPDKTKVKIDHHFVKTNVTFTMTVTDSSDAPPRTITYTDPSSSKNESFTIDKPLINGASFVKNNFTTISISKLQKDYKKGVISFKVYSSNNIGGPIPVKAEPYTYIASSPLPTSTPTSSSPPTKKSKTTSIVVGVVVPVVVIAIIIAVIVGAYYYIKKKRRNSGFSPLRSIPDDAVPGTYGTTNS
ncbi:PREDICTED: uncharacterized protein LOC100633809 isoform X1 [Amphimedon queenslandica]|uniref:Ig-like domain-containing protein n=1 Tax=Amphimedon queenslandica TaxID=400682 RepID=A0A1X7UTA6_AMPQE|nr:PREDICTED: uncharacterized protein LOC100633809 isoform X1 [Amphimedon queenslandica]|eukprot:XP_003386787.2 PREDICTED: uncharacterized protein LOC100633809 isoform X1 [Amphimedon queenslandica]